MLISIYLNLPGIAKHREWPNVCNNEVEGTWETTKFYCRMNSIPVYRGRCSECWNKMKPVLVLTDMTVAWQLWRQSSTSTVVHLEENEIPLLINRF